MNAPFEHPLLHAPARTRDEALDRARRLLQVWHKLDPTLGAIEEPESLGMRVFGFVLETWVVSKLGCATALVGIAACLLPIWVDGPAVWVAPGLFALGSLWRIVQVVRVNRIHRERQAERLAESGEPRLVSTIGVSFSGSLLGGDPTASPRDRHEMTALYFAGEEPDGAAPLLDRIRQVLHGTSPLELPYPLNHLTNFQRLELPEPTPEEREQGWPLTLGPEWNQGHEVALTRAEIRRSQYPDGYHDRFLLPMLAPAGERRILEPVPVWLWWREDLDALTRSGSEEAPYEGPEPSVESADAGDTPDAAPEVVEVPVPPGERFGTGGLRTALILLAVGLGSWLVTALTQFGMIPVDEWGPKDLPVPIVAGALFTFFGLRRLRSGVWLDDEGLTRGYFPTRVRVPWEEVQGVDVGVFGMDVLARGRGEEPRRLAILAVDDKDRDVLIQRILLRAPALQPLAWALGLEGAPEPSARLRRDQLPHRFDGSDEDFLIHGPGGTRLSTWDDPEHAGMRAAARVRLTELILRADPVVGEPPR